jgi:predicted ATP-grasp superfamily ATP-dependent carboligase
MVKTVLTTKPVVGKYIVTAFQTVGYISILAVSYLKEKKVIKEIGYIDPESTNVITVIEDGELKYPIRIFESQKAIFIMAQVPIARDDMTPISKEIIRLYSDIKAKGIIALDGLSASGNKNQSDVYYTASNFNAELNNVKPLSEGAMFGLNASIALQAKEDGVPFAVVMAETHVSIPDGLAAAALISSVKDLLGLEVDTNELVTEYKETLAKIDRLVKRARHTGTEEKPGQPGQEIYG